MDRQRAFDKLRRVLAPYSKVTPIEVTTPLSRINPLVGQWYAPQWNAWWCRKRRARLHELEDRLYAVFAVHTLLRHPQWIRAKVGHLLKHLTPPLAGPRYERRAGDRNLSRTELLHRLHRIMAPYHADPAVRSSHRMWGSSKPWTGVTERTPLSEFDEEFRDLLLQGAIMIEFNVALDDSTLDAATTVFDLLVAISGKLRRLQPKPPERESNNPYGN